MNRAATASRPSGFDPLHELFFELAKGSYALARARYSNTFQSNRNALPRPRDQSSVAAARAADRDGRGRSRGRANPGRC